MLKQKSNNNFQTKKSNFYHFICQTDVQGYSLSRRQKDRKRFTVGRKEHKTFKLSSGNGHLQEASDDSILHLGNMSHDLTAMEQNQTFFASTELFIVSTPPKITKSKEMTVR